MSREFKWLAQGYPASKWWSWDLHTGHPKPKPGLFSPNWFVIGDKKNNGLKWNLLETLVTLLMGIVQSFVNFTYESTSIFHKQCRPKKWFLNFLLPFFSPLALWVATVIISKKGSARKSSYMKKLLPLNCPNPQRHQWLNSICFPKEQRSDGAQTRSGPSDSSMAKSTPVHPHRLCFLSLTKWVRTAWEVQKGKGRGG